jgi:predicted nucleic acid-binding protein
MNDVFVLDACALIAFLNKENGFNVVRSVLQKSVDGDVSVFMHKMNLLEVYYDKYRLYGKDYADDIIERLRVLPIVVDTEITDDIFSEAGRLKATYKISIADAIALAEAFVRGGKLVTSDHSEFDAVESDEGIEFLWIR